MMDANLKHRVIMLNANKQMAAIKLREEERRARERRRALHKALMMLEDNLSNIIVAATIGFGLFTMAVAAIVLATPMP